MFQPRFFSDFWADFEGAKSRWVCMEKRDPLRAFLTKKHAKLIKDVSFLGKERRGIRGTF